MLIQVVRVYTVTFYDRFPVFVRLVFLGRRFIFGIYEIFNFSPLTLIVLQLLEVYVRPLEAGRIIKRIFGGLFRFRRLFFGLI